MKTIDEARTLVGQLPQTTLPIALLPVQIQTRFVTRDGVQQLLVRVYPDELHLDGHDPGLTAAEVEWGKRAWALAWPKRRGTDAERAAFDPLAERFGRQRAEWIARRLRPTNVNQRPQTAPVFPDPRPLRNANVTAPVLAKHLPDRWVVMGYRGGLRVLLEVGAPVAQQLTVGPTFDAAPLPDPGPEKLPLDAGLRWLVDFEEAERIGMGIRIVIPPDLVDATFDTLVVFGVRASLAPAAAAAELESLLDAQRYTRGLAFVAPGTPTNNTTDVSSGFRRAERDAGASFESAPVTAKAGSDAAVAARLLGIQPARVAGLEGAARTDDLDAKQLQTALWPVTGGYYLDQVMAPPDGQPPTFSPDQLEQARRHTVDFVRQLGPLPTIRAGRQPYGLLPAVSLDLLGGPAAGGRFVQSLRFMRDVWRNALFQVPRLEPGAQNADALVEILRIQPSSVGYRVRPAMDSHFFAPTDVFSSDLSDHLKSHEQLLRLRLQGAIAAGLASQERFFQIIPADAAVDLRSPLVQPGVQVPGAPPDPNFITFLRTASFDQILAESVPGGAPNSLLYMLLRHSVLLAYASTAQRILVRRGQLPNVRYREPAFVDIVGPDPPFPTLTLLRAATADPTLRATLHTLTAAQEPEAAVLEELRAALRHLEALPVDALARQLSGCLDLFAYRLDAWITSLATRRLSELRQATPRGLALGGFGWVQGVGPSPRTPVAAAPPGEGDGPLFAAREAGGFIHAPSLTQASAAAVLRSGFLAHANEGDAGALAVDLASDRVRLAESLLDGIRQGQKLGALLGYRFERGLHERQLDRFIAGFRRVAWLAVVYNAQAALEEVELEAASLSPRERIIRIRQAQAQVAAALTFVRGQYQLPASAGVPELEAQAAAKVVDGLVLSRLHEAGAIPFDRLGVPVGNDQPALEAELDALDAAVDALSDALTAESVFQLLRGNANRASATVDAVAHGEIPPPELQFPETPRPGVALTHRLLVVLSGQAPAVPAGVRATRRAAEPNLDAWLKQMIGDVAGVRFRAELLGPGGDVVLARENLRLTMLGVSNTDALYLSATSRPGLPSDLERLLEYQLRRAAPATVPADAPVRFGYGRVPGTAAAELSLGEFLELNAAFRAAILGARPLDGRDFVQATSATPTSADDAELRARADRAVAALKQARDALATQLAAAHPALDTIRQRLVDLVFLGIPEAVPVSPRGNAPADRDALLAQGAAVKEEATRRLDRAPAGADPRARLEVVFGRGFRVLPLVRPPNAAQLGSALAASDTLLGGDPLQALSWLQGVGRVRSGASRLGKALDYAAALQRPGSLDLKVAQLPFVAGERWVGLRPPAGKSFPPGKLSLVVHLPRPFQAAQPLAGLVIDEWTETVPAAEVTTGVAFHYDAPGARPPQAVLLAVAPPGPARWDVETLEKTLLETLELAQLRALDPQALAADELLQRAFPAVYVTANIAGEQLSTDFARMM